MSRHTTAERDLAARARPFLKWAGGKGQLAPEILARFPANYGTYYEPFVGGGATFFALQPRRAFLSDINSELITTYCAVRDDVTGVIAALREHRYDRGYFDYVRALDPSAGLDLSTLNAAGVAARMIFLNRSCFNGLYRVNRAGKFNVPFGRYKNPTICNTENLTAVSNALASVDLRVKSVFESVLRARRGDLVYFDPPYDPLTPSASFTAYTAGGFGPDEQARLAELFGDLARRGVHVLLSNSDTPLIRKLYRGFRIDTVYARRAINSRADKHGQVGELLITAG